MQETIQNSHRWYPLIKTFHLFIYAIYVLPPPDEEDGDAGDEHCGADEGGGGDGGDLAPALVSSIVGALDAAAVPEEGGGVERVSEGGLQVKGRRCAR